jgi:hypothetical protein
VTEPQPALPGQLRAAAIVVLLQAAGLVAVAAVLIVKILGGGYDSAGRAWSDAAFALLGAGGLVAAARALTYLKLAVRTPLLLVEVLALPVGYSLGIQAGRIAYGGPVMIGALAVLILLFTRPARDALERRPRP